MELTTTKQEIKSRENLDTEKARFSETMKENTERDLKKLEESLKTKSERIHSLKEKSTNWKKKFEDCELSGNPAKLLLLQIQNNYRLMEECLKEKYIEENSSKFGYERTKTEREPSQHCEVVVKKHGRILEKILELLDKQQKTRKLDEEED